MEFAGKETWLAHAGRWAVLYISAIAIALALSGRAEAAPGCEVGATPCPPLLYALGEYGTAAGQMLNPAALAADPDTGHVFVADGSSARIDEFDSHGDFVKAWGWGVRDGVSEPQICTTATTCREGLFGDGAGQLNLPLGIALDEEGNIWVVEALSRRVQKFSQTGDFLLMVGGEVNKTKVSKRKEQEANAEPVTVTESEENLCTAASGNLCGQGTSGTGNGQFSIVGFNDAISVAAGGTIYAGDKNRILKFDEEGAYLGAIPLAGGEQTLSLTITPDNRLYVISSGVKEKVGGFENFKVDSTVVREIGPFGEELSRLVGEWESRKTPKDPAELASDAEGNVYVIARVVYTILVEGGEPKFKEVSEVVAFDDEGDLINFELDQAGFGAPTDSTGLFSIAANTIGDGSGKPGEVFVGHFLEKNSLSYVNSYGIPFEPEVLPPSITSQYATAVAAEEASVEALIKPGFTIDTTYQVEYGIGPCSPGSCEFMTPGEPVQLGSGAVNTPQKTGLVQLTGLQPGTTYHFRFRAENEVTVEEESGPVFGAEGTFRTYATPGTSPCPNDPLRLSASAKLPDCRAYEMVSPVNKGGGEIFVLPDVPEFPAEINQGAPGGEELTYSSYRAFADPKSAPYTSQYISRRSGGGWMSEPISPLREGVISPGIETQYRAFSEDLSRAWLVTDSEPVLAEGGLPGYRNLYRRDNGSGNYQAQCAVEPLESSPAEFNLEPQGASADGSHLLLRANAKLPPYAAASSIPQLYECVNGTELRLVSVLPGGGASTTGAAAGAALSGVGGDSFRLGNVTNAISEDGSRIFWTAATTGPGPLYVRIGGSETVEIATANARFRAASPDGGRVIYSVGEDLFEAAVEPGAATSTKIAGEVEGVMGMSEDTQLVYLVSREDLDGEGGATAGKPNLYLYSAEEDGFTFIGILSEDDARESFGFDESAPLLTPVALSPYNRSSRVSADGLHAAFTSSARLTGYDNTDQASGEADAEVFLYDVTSEELLCASCNPTNARPRGANVAVPVIPFWAAAYIPGWENQFHGARALSEDGSRLFFNAIDPLALGDTNGAQDVYQWEAAGTGTCTASSPTYSPANGGCVDLISTGKSPQPSELVDASSDGEDVFFKTAQSLWPADPGLVDIYDARVEGGFPPPPPPKLICTSDCQQRGPEPQAPAQATALPGPGNVVEGKKKPKKCRKGTHKVRKGGKVRCVKNKGKASTSRRAAR